MRSVVKCCSISCRMRWYDTFPFMFRRFLHDFCRNSRGAVTTCMFSLQYVGVDPLMSSDVCCSTLQNERQTDAQKHSNITYLAQNFWTSQKNGRVESIENYPYMTKLFRASNVCWKNKHIIHILSIRLFSTASLRKYLQAWRRPNWRNVTASFFCVESLSEMCAWCLCCYSVG